MPDYCENGQFDGYQLTTNRDRELCRQGGGTVVSRGEDKGACAGSTVQNFSAAQGNAVDLSSLRAARSIFDSTEEVALLRELSAAAVPAVEDVIRNEPKLAERMVTALDRINALAAMVLDSQCTDILYTEEDHQTFVRLARDIAERAKDRRLSELLDAATHLAEPFQGMRAGEVRDRLGPLPDSASMPIGEAVLALPSLIGNLDLDGELMPGARIRHHENPVFDFEFATVYDAAQEAISAKAKTLGGMALYPQGGVRRVNGGFVQRFTDCDIYYSEETGAHEVHGEIRRKYRQVNGPIWLGLSTTDETTCPDGRGRFNHFAKSASIYWTPTTGPFYVRESRRFRWASDGWELGDLGYPVQDELSLSSVYPWSPESGPIMYWSHFQNGIVFGRGPEALNALAATASRQQLINAIRVTLDRKMEAKNVDIGPFTVSVRPGLFGIDFLGVDDWGYGFNGSTPRILRIRINGFVSIPIFSDPTFEIEMGLQFSARWATTTFLYPAEKKIVATLIDSRIKVNGIASESIASSLKEAIISAFTLGPAHPEITDRSMVLGKPVPTGANQKPGSENLDFLDVMLMADGSLNVYVNPLPVIKGGVRKFLAQRALDAVLENL